MRNIHQLKADRLLRNHSVFITVATITLMFAFFPKYCVAVRAKLKGVGKCTDLRVGRIGPLRCQRSHVVLVGGVVVGKVKNKAPMGEQKNALQTIARHKSTDT